jgi:hypothetical protein
MPPSAPLLPPAGLLASCSSATDSGLGGGPASLDIKGTHGRHVYSCTHEMAMVHAIRHRGWWALGWLPLLGSCMVIIPYVSYLGVVGAGGPLSLVQAEVGAGLRGLRVQEGREGRALLPARV